MVLTVNRSQNWSEIEFNYNEWSASTMRWLFPTGYDGETQWLYRIVFNDLLTACFWATTTDPRGPAPEWRPVEIFQEDVMAR